MHKYFTFSNTHIVTNWTQVYVVATDLRNLNTKAKNVFLNLKWPFIEQPRNHIGLDNSLPFASINLIFMEINPRKFGKKTNSSFTNLKFKI